MGEIVEIPQRIIIRRPPESGPEIPAFVIQSFVGGEFPVQERVAVVETCPAKTQYGFKISKNLAIRIIRRKSREAAEWIRSHPELFPKPFLIINEEACLRPESFCPMVEFEN